MREEIRDKLGEAMKLAAEKGMTSTEILSFLTRVLDNPDRDVEVKVVEEVAEQALQLKGHHDIDGWANLILDEAEFWRATVVDKESMLKVAAYALAALIQEAKRHA